MAITNEELLAAYNISDEEFDNLPDSFINDLIDKLEERHRLRGALTEIANAGVRGPLASCSVYEITRHARRALKGKRTS